MDVSTDFEAASLPLSVPFEIARGEHRETDNVIVTLADDEGERGVGGAAPTAYYGDTVESVTGLLPDLLSIVEANADEIDDPEALEDRMADRVGGVGPRPHAPAARAAVSCAIYDLFARRRDDPLYDVWGLDPEARPPTSYSIGIAEPSVMAERAEEVVAEGFEILKVKLGTDADRERLEAVRAAVPDAGIRVDANGAWTPDEALANADWLADLDVEFIEQPVPAEDVAGLRRVHEESPVPVAADESCPTAAEVSAVADATDIVVVKLTKAGGVGPAREAIAAAHEHDCEVLLGCMVETNASIAPACHLAPLVEYVDLDGSLLLASDPCDGVAMPGGRIDLASVERGTGARFGDDRSG